MTTENRLNANIRAVADGLAKLAKVVTCPRCDGDGEEVGAPVELDGVWLCSLCNGRGEVSVRKARRYVEDE
jgi:DnaJ-class molecular chaperone